MLLRAFCDQLHGYRAETSIVRLTRSYFGNFTAASALDWRRQRAPKQNNRNPRDQFGLLCRGAEIPQVEKLDKKGFENPWIMSHKKGEELLEQETTQKRAKWEMNADQFANAPVISLPFRTKLKVERQRRKEIREYTKVLKALQKMRGKS